MGEFDYSIDKHFWEFYLDSTEDDVVIREDTDGDGTAENTDTISIGAGWYYNHNTSTSAAATTNQGLLRQFIAALNNSSTLTGNYAVNAQTPPTHSYTGTNSLTDAGIQIVESSGNINGWFELDIADSSWTLDPRYLGFPNPSNSYTAQSSAAGDSKNTLNSPYSLWAQWQVHNLVRDAASDKRKRTITDTRTSSGDSEQARGQKLNQYDVRRFEYEILPGAMVRKDRGHDEGSAKLAKVGWDSSLQYANRVWGEVHNAWADLFEMMVTPRQDNGELRSVIVLHDTTGHELRTGSELMDRVRLRKEGSNSDMMDPNDFWETQEPMGELHSVEYETQIIESWNYRQ